MKKTNVTICDSCKKVVANKKCSICEKDLCNDCTNEEGFGTVTLDFCKDCFNKLERSGFERKGFWDEFNKKEDIQKKIVIYLKKNLIINNLSDEDEEDEDEEGDETTLKGIRRVRRGKFERKRLYRNGL